MEFFGLTAYGVSDPVKYFVRPDYEEPETFPTVEEILARGECHKNVIFTSIILNLIFFFWEWFLSKKAEYSNVRSISGIGLL